jgi:hypothetical protein
MLFVGLAATGFSQEKPQRVHKSPEERAQKMTDVLTNKLSLSEAQKTQIYQINLERAQAMEKLKADKKEIDRSQVKAQFEASDKKIIAVLNESQRVSYAQFKEDRKEKMKKHRRNHHKGENKSKA